MSDADQHDSRSNANDHQCGAQNAITTASTIVNTVVAAAAAFAL